MTENDKRIIAAIKNIDAELDAMMPTLMEKNSAFETAQKKAVDAREALDNNGNVPFGDLHCDDAVNKGCIMLDNGYNRNIRVPVRNLPQPELKELAGRLYSMMQAEKEMGLEHAGENGHTIREWLEDVVRCNNAKTPLIDALEELEKKDEELGIELNKLVEILSRREHALDLMSEELSTELEISRIANPDTAPVVNDEYKLPDEILKLLCPMFDCVEDGSKEDIDTDEEPTAEAQ